MLPRTKSMLIIGIFFTLLKQGFSQGIQVTDPRLELQGDYLIITYDILNSLSTQLFTIRLELTDEDDRPINAKKLSGDVGTGITGGSGKQITWDINSEGLLIDGRIYAKVIAVPEAVDNRDQPVNAIKQDDTQHDGNRFSRTGLILQSLAVPGLGLSRYTGKPHWIRSVAGYGCIAGSILMNRQAIQTYGEIPDYTAYEDKKTHFDRSVRQDHISELLAYSAIAIWAADFIWTVAGTSDLKRIGVGAGFDPVTASPMIVLNYRF